MTKDKILHTLTLAIIASWLFLSNSSAEPVEVSTWNDLQSALIANNTEIMLSANIVANSSSQSLIINDTCQISGINSDGNICYIISGGNDNSCQLFSINTSSTGSLVFKDIILKSGKIDKDKNGGAIWSSKTARYTNTTFEGNYTTCTYTNDNNLYAKGGRGGAMMHKLYATNSNTADVKDSKFEKNGIASNGNVMTLEGGAVFLTDGAEIIAENTTFAGNAAKRGGGAISGASQKVDTPSKITISNGSSFTDNFAGGHGGAMYLQGVDNTKTEFGTKTTVTGTSVTPIVFARNYLNSSINPNGAIGLSSEQDIEGFGGAVFALGTESAMFLYTDFESNGIISNNKTTTTCGGAISAMARLNADNNKFAPCKITIQNSKFTENKSTSLGGAFHNSGADAVVDVCTFSKNTSTSGGAMYISAAKGKNNSDLVRQPTLTLINTTFSNNFATNDGGAITFNDCDISVLCNGTTFEGNYTTDEGDKGGAVHIEEGDIKLSGPNLRFSYNNTAGCGGAIYANRGNLEIREGTLFEGNSAKQNGGAIYANGKILEIREGTLFEGNSAEQNGGAIYANESCELKLIAEGGNIEFFGNSAEQNGGAVHCENLQIIAKNGGAVAFGAKYDKYSGDYIYSPRVTDTIIGNVIFNGSENDGGTLKFGHSDLINVKSITLRGGTLDTQNADTKIMEPKNFIVNADTNFSLGVDLSKNSYEYSWAESRQMKAMDTVRNLLIPKGTPDENLEQTNANVTPIQFSNGAKLKINSIKIITPDDWNTKSGIMFGPFALCEYKKDLTSTTTAAISYKEGVNFDLGVIVLNASNGDLIGTYKSIDEIPDTINGNPIDPTHLICFSVGDASGFQPSVMTSSVQSQTTGVIMQQEIYRESMGYFDTVMVVTKEERERAKRNSPYTTFRSKYGKYRRVWNRTCGSTGNVFLYNGPKIENTAFATIFGYDSNLHELTASGWLGYCAIYGSYIHTKSVDQGFESIGSGGGAGVSGFLYKGKFFAGFTANIGKMICRSSEEYSYDNFPVFAGGAATKFGYNFETFEGEYIIQPSLFVSYTYIDVANHENGNNLSIKSDPLHPIEVVPGLKLILNSSSSIKPFISVRGIWSFNDKTKFSADTIKLPSISTKPFIEYGAGIQKRFDNKNCCFIQVMGRSIGRQGIAIIGGAGFGF